MTALTAKAAWWVLEGWKGSPGSLRNDSFDGQSLEMTALTALPGGFWRVGRAVLDPLEMTALTAKAGT